MAVDSAIELMYSYTRNHYYTNAMLPGITHEDLQQECVYGLIKYLNRNPDKVLTPAFVKGVVRTISKSYKRSQMVVPGIPLYKNDKGRTRDAPRPFQIVFTDSIDYITESGDQKLLELAAPESTCPETDTLVSNYQKYLTEREIFLINLVLQGYKLSEINTNKKLAEVVTGRHYKHRWIRRKAIQKIFDRIVLKLERFT